MSKQREKTMADLRTLIESIDAGTVQVTVYKGMPVKAQLVSQEIVLGGDIVLNLEQVETFNKRIWWKNGKTP